MSTVAQAQVDGASALRAEANLAGAICRREAVYVYYETVLGPAAPPRRPALASWYVWTPVRAHGSTQTWSAYCRDLDATGDTYNLSLLALREYAVALGKVANAQAFDGSGLASAGTGAGSAAAALTGSSTISATAQGVGSAAASVATVVVGMARTFELKKSIAAAYPHVNALTGGLANYVAGLRSELEVLALRRNNVLDALAAHRDPNEEILRPLDHALAIDLAPEGGDRIARLDRQLDMEEKLLRFIGAAHHALAEAAGVTSNATAANTSATELEKAVTSLLNERLPQEL